MTDIVRYHSRLIGLSAQKALFEQKYEVAYDTDGEETTFIFSLISELKSGKLVVL